MLLASDQVTVPAHEIVLAHTRSLPKEGLGRKVVIPVVREVRLSPQPNSSQVDEEQTSADANPTMLKANEATLNEPIDAICCKNLATDLTKIRMTKELFDILFFFFGRKRVEDRAEVGESSFSQRATRVLCQPSSRQLLDLANNCQIQLVRNNHP